MSSSAHLGKMSSSAHLGQMNSSAHLGQMNSSAHLILAPFSLIFYACICFDLRYSFIISHIKVVYH